MNKLVSPNVIGFYGYDSKQYKIVMEFAENGTLYDYIVSKPALPWTERYVIKQGIVNGIKYIHDANIIHRDLKSDNILLAKNLQPKITDFGFSIFTNEHPDYFSGSYDYTAPEALNNEDQTQKSDMFSIGVIIAEMIKWCPIGHTRPEVVSLEDLVEYHESEKKISPPDDCPPKFKNVLSLLWKKNPEDRATAAETQQETLTDMDTLSPGLAGSR
jgi:serine/threonine-protein kinase